MELEPSSSRHRLSVTVLATPLALCRLAASEPVPEWTELARTFLTISRTPTELSIVADDAAVPVHLTADRGFRALRVEGPLPVDVVGVVAALAGPLASAGVAIFPIGTHDTDYVLVREGVLAQAVTALGAAGHRVVFEEKSAPAT